jgi:Rrf2 family protein
LNIVSRKSRPVSAKALAARHRLSPRHLEPVLQALVRDGGILKGVHGPHGGYELARERKHITAEDIPRAAGSAEDAPASRRCPAPRWSTTWCDRRWLRRSAHSPPPLAVSMSTTWRNTPNP